MSPEWMFALERAERTARGRNRNRLSDPLERQEWKGLGWLIGLFVALSSRRRHGEKRAAPGGFGRSFRPLAVSRRN